ncbi:MAG: PrgI family protein [bacterium]|nr:PrgI family protein [bacterium]
MRQYQVPQFITVEDKIFGPFTLRQFIYLIAGLGIMVIFWNVFEMVAFIIFSIPVASLAVSLAYLKINEQPLAKVILNGFHYFVRPRLYIWKKKRPEIVTGEAEKKATAPVGLTKLTESKLNDLAWSLDIKEKLQR